MGTDLEIAVRARDRASALAVSEAASQAVVEADRRLSTWRGDSELSAVNRRDSDRPQELSPMLARDLGGALRWHQRTAGFFSPGLGALVSAWDLRGVGRVPSDTELRQALLASTVEGTILVDRLLHLGVPGLQFEEGGFGKGVALRDALDSALARGAECVVLDFGGQVAVGGDCGATAIGVSDPSVRHQEVAVLELIEGSAATSGLSERNFTINGTRRGHILDPHTGLPAPDWGGVTVVAADPMVADCLATALFVMGPVRGPEWVREQEGIEAIFAERKGSKTELTATPGLRGRLRSLGGKIEYLPLADQRMNE
jgi:thiamine biosynthesis lipoprotein